MHSHTRLITTLTTFCLLMLTAAACRTLAVQTEAAPTYMIDVRNTISLPMIVQFDDGRGARLLGTVPAGGQERFIIAGASRAEVAILATSEDGTRSVRREIVLQPGVPVNVSLGS
jgi:hypothetical protein